MYYVQHKNTSLHISFPDTLGTKRALLIYIAQSICAQENKQIFFFKKKKKTKALGKKHTQEKEYCIEQIT